VIEKKTKTSVIARWLWLLSWSVTYYFKVCQLHISWRKMSQGKSHFYLTVNWTWKKEYLL